MATSATRITLDFFIVCCPFPHPRPGYPNLEVRLALADSLLVLGQRVRLTARINYVPSKSRGSEISLTMTPELLFLSIIQLDNRSCPPCRAGIKDQIRGSCISPLAIRSFGSTRLSYCEAVTQVRRPIQRDSPFVDYQTPTTLFLRPKITLDVER
jgi:hypothetical protein